MTKNSVSDCTPAPASVAPAAPAARTRTVIPRADVWQTDDAAHLAIELPGVAKEALDLRIENDRLIVSATPSDVVPDGRAVRLEWRPVAFMRTFVLTDDADRDAIDAQLKHGLLTVTIPRRAEKRPRSIEVRVDAD
mgnify:CR=1 FL=1